LAFIWYDVDLVGNSVATQSDAATSMPFVRRISLRGVALVIFLAALWLILWRELSGEWSVNDQYSYGWFVPFFAIVLFWLRFEDRPQVNEVPSQRSESSHQSSVIALGFAIITLVLLFPIRLFEIGNPDWRPLSWLHALCVVAITLIVLWSIGGAPWLKHFAFPAAFTLVAVPWISPIEAPVTQELMRIIAAFAAETANLLGIPAQVQGNLIQVQTGVIGVNEACSGVRSLQTSLMIGLLFGELKRLSILRRVALLAGAIAIALVANFFRAVFLVWIGASEGISAIDRWHGIAGYSIVVLVFIGSLALAALLGQRRHPLSAHRYSETNNKERITNNAAAGWFPKFRLSYFANAIAWLIAVEVGAAAWYHVHERNEVTTSRWSVHWPNNAPGFREFKIDEGVRSTLRYDEGGQAVWNVSFQNSTAENKPARCMAFFFRWKPGGSSVVRARAHRPDICLPAAGWRQVSDRGLTSYAIAPDLSLLFHHLVFEDARTDTKAHTFFCLQEDELRPNEPRPDLQVSGGAQPDWGLAGRSRVVRDGIRNRGQQIIEVVLLSHEPLSDQQAESEFAKLAPSIIKVQSKN
jgi:exosortase